MMKIDGHIHSPYCPHGTDDSFEQYIDTAIRLGFEEISFTEHAPLPTQFVDPTPDQDSGMNLEQLDLYLSDLQKLKHKYKANIKINIGLEVDYIVHFEQETTKFLNEYGRFLDDSILSVHFLYHEDQYYCLDYNDEEFANIVSVFGNTEKVYKAYYQLLKKSVLIDLGSYKPKRIGHMTLVRKFHKKFRCDNSFKGDICTILDLIKNANMALDYNGAGVNKPLCQEPYPSNWVVQEANKRKIPLIYGSDAHRSRDLNQGYADLVDNIKLSSPSGLI